MSSQRIFIWRRSSNKLRQGEAWLECLCLIGLLVAALALFLVNLSSLPLLDAREATVAQVAKEICHSTKLVDWIFPTLWDEPYLAQPPLVQDSIAIAYRLGGIGEFTTRLPGALLGAFSVLLIYQIGREIFVARLPALFSALVYLTCLPVVRYSRLAALDGPLLFFELLTIWAALRSRRDLKWALGIGIGITAIGLIEGFFAVQILSIVLLFLLWDTPRLLSSTYFWSGLALGIFPSTVWYTALLVRYHQFDLDGNLLNLVLAQTSSYLPLKESSPGYYLLVAVQYFLPWLTIVFGGVKLIKHNLHWGWGKLLAVWLGGYLILGFLLLERDYWLILPLYPALALAAGKQLNRIYNLPSSVVYPRSWIYSFASMAILAALAGLNWGVRNYIDFYLPFICGSLCITFAATAIVIAQRDKQFIPLLFWGLLVSLFLLVVSPHWIWELKLSQSVKPIARLVQQHTPSQTIIYGSVAAARPSLSFYSDRQIIPLSVEELQRHWQQDSMAYLLVEAKVFAQLDLPKTAVVEDKQLKALGWILVFKGHSSVLAESISVDNLAIRVKMIERN